MKKRIAVAVTKEDTGYSAYATVGKNFIGTQAESVQELKDRILEAIKLTFPGRGVSFAVKYTFDLESFF